MPWLSWLGDRKRPVSCTSWTYLGEGEEGVVWISVCGAHLRDRANGGSVEVFVYMVSMVLVLLGVGVILGNGYGI